MMNFSSVYERHKRPNQMFPHHPLHNTVANYWTEAFQKSEIKQEYEDISFLNNLHLIPDPLKKNLADTLFTNEKPQKPVKPPEMAAHTAEKVENTTKMGGIGSFFTGVFNVLSGVMFRSRSPVNYYECFEESQQGSPQAWHPARTDVKDKNGNAKSYDESNVSTDMNADRTVTNCENKINQVLNLLAPRQNTTSSPVWIRKRPKKVFVDPNSVSESFEDAFSLEDFVNLPEDPYFSCYSPMQYQNVELFETVPEKTMLNTMKENMEIVKDVNKNDLELKTEETECNLNSEKQENTNLEPLKTCNLNTENELEKMNKENSQQCVVKEQEKCKLNLELKSHNNTMESQNTDNKLDENREEIKCQLVASCEDKLSKLKALLLEKRKKNKETVPEMQNEKPVDKHYKNTNRRTEKRCKSKLKCKIEDDLLFANEISVGTPPSIENSPREHNVNFGDYFDEMKGRFRSASIGSEDSFQIVFNDSPRIRTSSDCDSEDSFIVFEDSPDSCYMSNDVFGSDSEMSDSGCVSNFKLSHNLTRTVSNLADDSEDEVDFTDTGNMALETETGLLLNEKKKQIRKSLPAKKVHFSPAPPKVHVMRVWAFAARQARAGHWERYAIDRERFKRRIADVEVAISWTLRPQHRSRVMFQRFMPWWNQQKRRELAEREEKIRLEKEEELNRQKVQELEDSQVNDPQEELKDTQIELKDSQDKLQNTHDVLEDNIQDQMKDVSKDRQRVEEELKDRQKVEELEDRQDEVKDTKDEIKDIKELVVDNLLNDKQQEEEMKDGQEEIKDTQDDFKDRQDQMEEVFKDRQQMEEEVKGIQQVEEFKDRQDLKEDELKLESENMEELKDETVTSDDQKEVVKGNGGMEEKDHKLLFNDIDENKDCTENNKTIKDLMEVDYSDKKELKNNKERMTEEHQLEGMNEKVIERMQEENKNTQHSNERMPEEHHKDGMNDKVRIEERMDVKNTEERLNDERMKDLYKEGTKEPNENNKKYVNNKETQSQNTVNKIDNKDLVNNQKDNCKECNNNKDSKIKDKDCNVLVS